MVLRHILNICTNGGNLTGCLIVLSHRELRLGHGCIGYVLVPRHKCVGGHYANTCSTERGLRHLGASRGHCIRKPTILRLRVERGRSSIRRRGHVWVSRRSRVWVSRRSRVWVSRRNHVWVCRCGQWWSTVRGLTERLWGSKILAQQGRALCCSMPDLQDVASHVNLTRGGAVILSRQPKHLRTSKVSRNATQGQDKRSNKCVRQHIAVPNFYVEAGLIVVLKCTLVIPHRIHPPVFMNSRFQRFGAQTDESIRVLRPKGLRVLQPSSVVDLNHEPGLVGVATSVHVSILV